MTSEILAQILSAKIKGYRRTVLEIQSCSRTAQMYGTERSKACKITNTFVQYLLVKLVTNVPVH